MPESSNLLVFVVAIPAFVLSIAWEWWRSTRREEPLYEVADTLTNLHLGSGQLLVSLLTKAPLLALYYAVHQWATAQGVPTWSQTSWGAWIIGFLIMDCAYYWFHRLSHEVNFLWAAHAVHHQSERYNLSVALRQSWAQQIFSGVFYMPLALLGIPVEMFFLLNALNTLSQFWIHTQLIGKLGPLELFLNTPSHHRVHHGVDDDYVDKNYAGFLIIWDRMFGTFTEETSSPRYGVIKPLRSWSPLWANLDVWAQLWRRARRGALRVSELVQLPLRPPAWRGNAEAPPSVKLRTDHDYLLYKDRGALWLYGALMGVIDILLGSALIIVAPQLSTVEVGCGVAFILLSATLHSGCVEGRSWARLGAWSRIGLGVAVVWLAQAGWIPLLASSLVVIGWGALHIGAALLLTWCTRRARRAHLA